MGQMIEGRWDCSSCGKKMIQGRYKHCPGCGKGRGADVKFYVADPNDVVAADVPEKGPDWLCEYCQAYAPDSAAFCPNCGAPRAGKTYHEIQQEQEKPPAAVPVTRAAPKRSPVLLIVLAALAVFALVYVLIPRSADARITAKAWQRQIAVESYQWVDEADWSLPADGVLKESRTEIRDYVQVLDHYETRSREVPEQYISGYSTEYRDLGNGYFESYQVPQYDTRYRTEYYEAPVYRSDPIYDTRYYYQIQRWVYDRTLTAAGQDDTPLWPQETLAPDTEREGGRKEEYAVRCESEKDVYTVQLPLEQWQTFQVGDRVSLQLSAGGSVREITKAK